jgi:hypothetical protein
LALLKGEDAKDELDKYDIEECHKQVDQYIETEDPSAALVLSDRLKINECFYYLKTMLKSGGGRPIQSNQSLAKQSITNESKL